MAFTSCSVPPSPIFHHFDMIFLSREGCELEVDMKHVTPSMMARAFEVWCSIGSSMLVYTLHTQNIADSLVSLVGPFLLLDLVARLS